MELDIKRVSKSPVLKKRPSTLSVNGKWFA